MIRVYCNHVHTTYYQLYCSILHLFHQLKVTKITSSGKYQLCITQLLLPRIQGQVGYMSTYIQGRSTTPRHIPFCSIAAKAMVMKTVFARDDDYLEVHVMRRREQRDATNL